MYECISRHSTNDSSPLSLALHVNPNPGLYHLQPWGEYSMSSSVLCIYACPISDLLRLWVCGLGSFTTADFNYFIGDSAANSIQDNTNWLREKYQLIEGKIPGETQTERESSITFRQGWRIELQRDVGHTLGYSLIWTKWVRVRLFLQFLNNVDTKGAFTVMQTSKRQWKWALFRIFFQALHECFQPDISCFAKDFEPWLITLKILRTT